MKKLDDLTDNAPHLGADATPEKVINCLSGVLADKQTDLFIMIGNIYLHTDTGRKHKTYKKISENTLKNFLRLFAQKTGAYIGLTADQLLCEFKKKRTLHNLNLKR